MSLTPKKIQKLRTFRGDMEALQVKPAETPTAPVTPVAAVPKRQLPPVLNEKKPQPDLPSLKKPPAKVPLADKPAVGRMIMTEPTEAKPLQDNISAVLGEVKPPAATPSAPASAISQPLIKAMPTPIVTRELKEQVSVMDTAGNDDLGGTIITNQKHQRFQLLPSIIEAIKKWFIQTEHQLEKRAADKRAAIPTVRTVEERRETIKKAASIGALAPKDDYAKLAKKLPQSLRPAAAEQAPAVIITEKEKVPAPGWSHFEGPTPLPAPTVEVKAVPAPVVKPPVVPPPIEKVEVPQSLPEIPTPTIPSTPAPEPEVPRVEPVAVPNIVTPPPESIPVRVVTLSEAPGRSRQNFSWLFYVGVATTAVVAAVSGAGLVTWLFGDNPTNNAPIVNTVLPTTFVTPLQETSVAEVRLPFGRTDWYDEVSRLADGNITTIMPVVNIGGAKKTATTEEVLAMLNWKLEPTLLRSIKEITFIKAYQKPAIVLKVSAFDSAFGGILLSERALSGELAPLFGQPVTATYKASVGTVPPEFGDELAENRDVRVLKDELSNERLVYGFTDQNTVIVAPDKETFLLISKRLR